MPSSWNAAGSILAPLPVAVLLLLSYALAPPPGHLGRIRLGVIRAALVTGAFAVLTVELSAAFHALTAPVFRSWWLAAVAAAGLAAWSRLSRRQREAPDAGGGSGVVALARSLVAAAGDKLRAAWLAAGRVERVLAVALAGLIVGELLVAFLAEPNNFDSQTYHLPRIEHWVLNQDVGPYPTAIHRQVTLAPGAEYLLLHLRLLTGGDALYHLSQWAAGIGCLLAASRIAAQFGAGQRGQLVTAFLVGTTPMVVMQSTSTQNDLVTAAWVACVATLVLDGVTARATVGSVLALGTATGLTAVTKNSGLLAAGPLLVVWAVAQVRLATRSAGGGASRGGRVRRVGTALSAAAGVLAVAAVLVGPFVGRTAAEFGHPLGPPRLRDSIPMQRYDPPAVFVNALRIGHTALDTPIAPVRRATADAIVEVAELVGVDPQDRSITFGQTTFPVPAWYPDEDRVSFPVTGVLALIGVGVALASPRRLVTTRRLVLRGYAGALVTAVVLYAATVKWQPWGNRLLLFALVLATPLAGIWLDAVLRRAQPKPAPDPVADRPGRPVADRPGRPVADRPGRPVADRPGRPVADRPGRRGSRAAPAIVAVVLSVAAVSAVLSLSYGFPRRLVGTGSVLAGNDWDTRFLRRPGWADEFRWAADAVDAAGAQRVGLVQQNDNWEYPWWLLLRGREIVALQSVLPNQPPADPASVDAVVCTGKRAVCQKFVPSGWRLEFRDYVGYALPSPGVPGVG